MKLKSIPIIEHNNPPFSPADNYSSSSTFLDDKHLTNPFEKQKEENHVTNSKEAYIEVIVFDEEEKEVSQSQSTSTTSIYLFLKKRNCYFNNIALRKMIGQLPPGTHLCRCRLLGPSPWVIQPA